MESSFVKGDRPFLTVSLIKATPTKPFETVREAWYLDESVVNRLLQESQNLRRKESQLLETLFSQGQPFLSRQDDQHGNFLSSLINELTNALKQLGVDQHSFCLIEPHRGGGNIRFLPPASRIAFLFDEQQSRSIKRLEKLRQIDEGQLKEESELSAYSKATKIGSLLETAMNHYALAFSRYLERILNIVPDIRHLSPSDYCRNMKGAGAQTELNLSLEPSNTLIVDEIIEYYAATEMLQMERYFAGRSDILACSHQHCGRASGITPIVLNDNPQLKVTARTNFGYGRSSYFHAALSFRGLSVINAEMIIYFKYDDSYELANTTWLYNAEQESFDACFADAIRTQEDFKTLGERGFVEKYVIGSVSKLTEALQDISSSEHFASITDVALLMDLTSSTHSTFLSGSNEMPTALDILDMEFLERFARQASCERTSENKYRLTIPDDEALLIQKRFALREDRGALEQDERIRLAKAALSSILVETHGETLPLRSVYEFVESVLPSNTAYTVKHCGGVDINLERTRLAQRVVKLSESLTATCKTAGRLDLLQELIGVCETIRQQNKKAEKTLADMLETAKARALSLEDMLTSTTAQKQGADEEREANALEINRGIQESKDAMKGAAQKLNALERFSEELDAWKATVASRKLSPLTSGGAE